MEPQPLDLDAPIGEAGRVLIVETETGRVLVKVSRTAGKSWVKAHLPNGLARELSDVPAGRPLRQVVASLAGARPLQAFTLPNSSIAERHRPLATLAAMVPFILSVALLAGGVFWDAAGWWRFLLAAAGITLMVVTSDAWSRSRRHRYWQITSTRGAALTADEVQLPSLAEEFDVDDVKEEYGRLVSDIRYRIEHPALFDTRDPAAKAFTLALLQWDNNDGIATPDERRALAQTVRDTFAAAKTHAERVGMAHLPEEARGRAQTALKTAAVAADEASPAPEREAALRRTVAILDELALYYLPTGSDARKAITGRGAPQLPGRRSA